MKLMAFVPAAVLALGSLLLSGIREQRSMPPRAPITTLPSDLVGFRGRDLVVPDEERKVAGMSDYAMRAFGPDSTPAFTLYVGYYDKQVQGKSIHSPKNCLPGAGWEIMATDRRSLANAASAGTVNRVLLANRGVRALVYYWYQGRGRIESSEYKVKWNLLADAARYGRTEEALVRIVIPISSKAEGMSEAQADELASRVMSTVVPEISRVLPSSPSAT